MAAWAGFGTNMINCWLLLSSVAEKAKSELILLILKREAGETKTIAVMTVFTENYSGQALILFSRKGKQAQSLFSVILGFV